MFCGAVTHIAEKPLHLSATDVCVVRYEGTCYGGSALPDLRPMFHECNHSGPLWLPPNLCTATGI